MNLDDIPTVGEPALNIVHRDRLSGWAIASMSVSRVSAGHQTAKPPRGTPGERIGSTGSERREDHGGCELFPCQPPWLGNRLKRGLGVMVRDARTFLEHCGYRLHDQPL